MIDENARAAFAAELARLPDAELLDVLRRLFAQRRPYPEEDAHHRNRFFLGSATQFLADDEITWEPWEISAIAYPKTGQGIGPDQGFCNSGHCATCTTDVDSNAKEGTCPICNTDVYMT